MASAKKTVAAKSETMVYIHSALASSQEFTMYEKGGADLPVVGRKVHIKGGAGMPTKFMITPLTVMTPITEEDYDAIKDGYHFKFFIETERIRVEKRKTTDMDKVASDMNISDPSANNSPESFAGEGAAAPMELSGFSA